MNPWVLNLALAAVLVWLLMRRRTRRWPRIAAQGQGFEDATATLGGFRVVEGPAAASWSLGTITRDVEGDYHWTPGGSVTSQRLGHVRVTDARLCGWWEGVWSLGTDWVVLSCTGTEATAGAGFELAAGRAGLRDLPELSRYADVR